MKHLVRSLTYGLLCAVSTLLVLPSPSAHAQVVAVGAKRYIKVIQPMELSRKDLDEYRIYSVADAVRYYSGVQFKDYNGIGGFKTINVRSLGSERMGVFYNGIEVGNAMNGQIDLTKFSLDNMGSLALYSGQKGDIFQSATDYASAGSLYMQSRRPRFKQDSKTNFKAGMRGGSFLYLNPSILYEHDLGNYITTSINWELVSSEGNYPFRYRRYNAAGNPIYDVKARRTNDRFNATRAEASLNGILDMGGIWSVLAYVYSSERGVPGAIVNNVWYRGERLTERNYFVQGNVKMDVKPGYRTQVNFKLSHDYIRYENNDDKIVKVDNSFKEYGFYFSNSHLWNIFDWWDLSGAYDFHFNHMQKRNELKDQADKQFSRPYRMKHLGSLSTQLSWNGLHAQASVLGTYVQNFGRKDLNDYKDEHAISPTGLISYTPFRRVDFSIQAFVKQTYRVPNYNDRYVSEVQGEILKPENMLQYDLGIIFNRKTDAVLREYGFTVEGYYNIIKDKIIAYPKGQLYRWTMTNLGKVEVIGGDATARMTLRFGEEFDLMTKVQYTYQQARDVTNKHDTYYKNQIPNIPWHSGSAILGLSWRGWALNYSFLYVGERYSRQENIPYYKMQPWYTHDLSLSKLLKAGDWKFRCMAELNNVLGDDFEIVTNYPMPKQYFRLTVTAEI